MFRPITVWPFPEQELAKICRGVRRVVVPEMNLGQMAGEVRKIIPAGVEFKKLNRIDGIPITPEEILRAMLE